ncbi:DUF4238 domain-containing protein [Candidatus Poribacteria bacterium]|nr:DUF4238 domain-containing protein [Candidatus Poribacteria bacterium]
MQRRAEKKFSTEQQINEILKEYEAQTGTRLNIAPQKLMAIVHEEKYTFKHHRNESILLMAGRIKKLVPLFLQMDWQFSYAPEESSFITSDNPFTVEPMGAGIGTKGSIKGVPLSQKSCLLIFDEGNRIDYHQLPKDKVRQINQAVAVNSDRFIIGRDEALLKRLCRRIESAVLRLGVHHSGNS